MRTEITKIHMLDILNFCLLQNGVKAVLQSDMAELQNIAHLKDIQNAKNYIFFGGLDNLTFYQLQPYPL